MVVRAACGLAILTYEKVLVATFTINFVCPYLEAVEKCQYIIMIESWHLNIFSSIENTNSWEAFRSISKGEKDSYTATAVEILYLIT